MINSKRPQTSYGGISARQTSLQKNRWMSSKPDEKIRENFGDIEDKDPDDQDINDIGGMFGMQNKLVQLKNKI